MWFLFLRRISRWNCSTEFVCFKISKHILPAVEEFVNLGQWFPRICIGTKFHFSSKGEGEESRSLNSSDMLF